MNIKKLSLCAVFTAVVCLVTRFIQIPIPLGYFNIGNCVILTFCYLMPLPYGIIIGSIGSAIADLTSYPIYTIPTLIIKALMPLLFYIIMKAPSKSIIKTYVAGAISMIIPLVGYTLVGGFLYGGFIAGLAQFPGLALEYVANCVLFVLMINAVRAAHLKKFIEQDVKYGTRSQSPEKNSSN